MHNHDQKARDMARSVLPSTRRRFARIDRRWVHKRERTAARLALREVRLAVDPDDVEADLTWIDREGITNMVGDRRVGDKVWPLLRWARVTIARDPHLADGDESTQRAHFRRVVGHGLTADHALFHLELSVFTRPEGMNWWWYGSPGRTATVQPPMAEVVRELLAGGWHAEVNEVVRTVPSPDAEEADDCDDPPRRRMLHGVHDVDAFVARLRPDTAAALRLLLVRTRSTT